MFELSIGVETPRRWPFDGLVCLRSSNLLKPAAVLRTGIERAGLLSMQSSVIGNGQTGRRLACCRLRDTLEPRPPGARD
jgi:hypothetical protein